MYSEVCTLFIQHLPTNINILHDDSTVPKPKKLALVHTIELIQISPVIPAFICVYVVYWAICNFITCVAFCKHHHNQDSELYHHHKLSSFYPIPQPHLL